MAAAVTLLGTATLNTTSGTHTVTATPVVGDLIVIIVANSGNVASVPPTDNNSSGTYTRIIRPVTASSANMLEFYVRNALIGAASSTVFTQAPGTSTGGGLAVLKVTGMTAVGAAAVRQFAWQSLQGAGTPAPVFPVAPSTHNAIIAAIMNATNPATMTPRGTPAYTERVDAGYITPTVGLEIMSIDSGETSKTITWGSASGSAFASGAIELAFDTAPTVALNTPADTGTVASTTPTLNFTGTDANSDAVEYELQIDSVNTFNSLSSTPVRLQAASGNQSTFASTVPTSAFGSPLTNNSTIIVGFEADLTSTNLNPPTDTAGNIYYRASQFAATHIGSDLEIWYSHNTHTTASNVITGADDGSGVRSIITAEEWSNLDSVFPLDQTAAGDDAAVPGTAIVTPATGSIAQANELVWVVAMTNQVANNLSLATGFTNLTQDHTNDANMGNASKLVSSIATYTGNMTTVSADWAAIVATFRRAEVPLIDVHSATDAGFTAGHPFASGVAVDYVVQSALTNGNTYFWRVRAIDPSDSNTYGAWSATRSFTVSTGGAIVVTAGMPLMGIG